MDTNITCKLQQIDTNEPEIKLTTFSFEFEDIVYLITTNHGLPIKSCYLDNMTDNEVSIYIDSVWNELLILKTKDPTELKPITKHTNKIPKETEHLFIKKDGKQIRLSNAVPHFLCLNDVPTNPKNIYIKAMVADNCFEVEKSFSGSPVFNENNKLVGILSKRNLRENCVYIIPTYFLIKTLTKKDNNSIYGLDNDILIKKINSTIVKNNFITHRILGVQMELDTYCLIEGDLNLQVLVNGEPMHYININEYLYIDNNKDLIFNKKTYTLSIRLFALLRTLYSDLGKQIFDIIKKYHTHNINVYINTNKIKQKKYYEITNEEINLKFVITPKNI